MRDAQQQQGSHGQAVHTERQKQRSAERVGDKMVTSQRQPLPAGAEDQHRGGEERGRPPQPRDIPAGPRPAAPEHRFDLRRP